MSRVRVFFYIFVVVENQHYFSKFRHYWCNFGRHYLSNIQITGLQNNPLSVMQGIRQIRIPDMRWKDMGEIVLMYTQIQQQSWVHSKTNYDILRPCSLSRDIELLDPGCFSVSKWSWTSELVPPYGRGNAKGSSQSLKWQCIHIFHCFLNQPGDWGFRDRLCKSCGRVWARLEVETNPDRVTSLPFYLILS